MRARRALLAAALLGLLASCVRQHPEEPPAVTREASPPATPLPPTPPPSPLAPPPSPPPAEPPPPAAPAERTLAHVQVRGKPLTPTRGKGRPFGPAEARAYAEIKAAGMRPAYYPVQWALLELDTGKLVAQSGQARRNYYGASLAKLFVAATLLSKRGGSVAGRELQLLADMIVASDNHAWQELQAVIGDGDLQQGLRLIQAFMQAHGLGASKGYNGALAGVRGNDMNAVDLVSFLRLTYKHGYPGADLLWRLLHSTADVDPKGSLYLPKSTLIAGKSGTFGPFHHHVLSFTAGGRTYGLAVLAESGSDRPLALVAGGLAREMSGQRRGP